MKFLRDFFLNDVGLKVTSVLLAFLLWFQIAGRETVQRTLTVPIEFTNLPADLVISNDYTRQADVTIRRPVTQRNPEADLLVVVDMRGKRPGSEIVQLSSQNVQAAFGVHVEDVNPKRIRLELERVVRKLVQIQPQTSGQPLAGYQLSRVELNPSEALVSGPESRVNALERAETERIDISGRSQSFRTRVFIDLEDTMLRIDNSTSTEALVIIEEERRTVRLGSFRVAVEPGDRLATLSPRTVQVFGSVPLSFEGEIQPTRFRVIARISAEETSSGGALALTPELTIPDEYAVVFRLERFEPEVVSVTVR